MADGFQILEVKRESDFIPEGNVIYGITRKVSLQSRGVVFCAFIKTWASWLFNAVVKAIICKCEEIECGN